MDSKTNANPSFLTVYFCGKESCEPGHSFGPAIRPHYLLHIILDGQGFYQKDGVTYTLKQGDAFLIPPMQPSYYQADRQFPWTYAWVGFDGTSCKEILEQTVFANAFVFRNQASFSRLQACTKHLLAAFAETQENRMHLLACLLDLLSCMQKSCAEKKEDYSSQYFQKAQKYIENNYAYPIRISDIARHVGIDRTYLYKIFVEHEHISPKQYLLQHRLRMAVQMLYSPAYTITEIALSCGFKDAPAFCNYFKKYTGATPRQFRKNQTPSFIP